MAGKIVLISDDSDFFEFIKGKLQFRKSDELFTFSFDQIPEKMHLLQEAVLIVDSECSQEKVLDLLHIFKDNPVIVSAFNDDEEFKQKCYKAGMFDYITLLTTAEDFQLRLVPAFAISSILEKNKFYRDILVKNNFLLETNEVFVNYNYILDNELPLIHSGLKKAVFVAISPNDKTKFMSHPSMVEAIIINNIRKNDILMNYAPNKYFLLLYDIELASAEAIWNKIKVQFPEKIYAGFSKVTNQKREQLINEVLNKLHIAINNDKDIVNTYSSPISSLNIITKVENNYSNFKLFRQEFTKKIEQVVTPVFYQIQQKYSDKLSGITLQQGYGEGYGTFYLKNKNSTSCFRISSPGFSKINIDITYQKDTNNIDAKRITLEPEELELGLLEDLLEQFISEYMRVQND